MNSMHQEKRSHPRFTLDGLTANITLIPFGRETIELKGQVIDISYSGIKICLQSPLPEESEGKVKIVIVLPESKIPLTIQGIIKHCLPGSKYGLQYSELSSKADLDLLMFECIKYKNTKKPDG